MPGARPGRGVRARAGRAILLAFAACLLAILAWTAAPAGRTAAVPSRTPGAPRAGASLAAHVSRPAPSPAGLNVSVFPNMVAAASMNTLTFTYATAQSFTFGEFQLVVPADWTSPTVSNTTASCLPGQQGCMANVTGVSATSAGPAVNINVTAACNSQTCTPVSGFQLTYGNAVAPSAGTSSVFVASGGPPGNLKIYGSQPVAQVPVTVCGNGAGVLSVSPASATVSHAAAFAFTYAPAGCGLALPGSEIAVLIPNGWTPPSLTPGTDGAVSTSAGAPSLSGRLITITGPGPGPGNHLQFSFGPAESSLPGTFSFYASERAGGGGILSPLASSPQITVTPAGTGPPGTSPIGTPTPSQRTPAPGTISVSPRTAAAGHPVTLTFTYTATGSGLRRSEAVTLRMPAGWTPPTVSQGAAGYSTTSAGRLSVSSDPGLVVTGARLRRGHRLVIVYHDGTPPRSPGSAVFSAALDDAGRAVPLAPPSVLIANPVAATAGVLSGGAQALLGLSTAVLLAAAVGSLVLNGRVIRRSRPARSTGIHAVSHPGPTGEMAIRQNGIEAALVVGIRADPGTPSVRTEQVTR